jgi:hypothetical protein
MCTDVFLFKFHFDSTNRVHTANDGRWESSINFWFPFMYSINNTVISKTELKSSVSQFLHSYICERFIYFQDRSAYSAARKYVDRSWEYINSSKTHDCGNWDWDRAIPRKGKHKRDFCCSAEQSHWFFMIYN